MAVGTDPEVLMPVEYWLDNGLFGKREFTKGDRFKKSPYRVAPQVEHAPFGSLKEELQALQAVMYAPQGYALSGTYEQYSSVSARFTCSYSVVVVRYLAFSRLEVSFTAVSKGVRTPVVTLLYLDGRPEPDHQWFHENLRGVKEGPLPELDSDQNILRVTGKFSTLTYLPSPRRQADPSVINVQPPRPDVVYADKVEMSVRYWPDEVNMPEVVCTFDSPALA